MRREGMTQRQQTWLTSVRQSARRAFLLLTVVALVPFASHATSDAPAGAGADSVSDASAAGRYIFPVAYDPTLLTWDERHWDGSLAVDIGMRASIELGASERLAFYSADLVAVTGGRASRLDNPRGGIAVLLHGDDGRTYYYAHLTEAFVDQPVDVVAGEPIGQVGNTGTWSQFLEPHLHLSMANGHQSGFVWDSDIDPVEWLREEFGLEPVRRARPTHPADVPEGLPVFAEAVRLESFEGARLDNPLLAGVTLHAAAEEAQWGAYGVRAPMAGVVTIHRDTPLGTRVQITNDSTAFSLMISGAIDSPLASGDLALDGSYLGRARGPLHYMVFRAGTPVDPESPPGPLSPERPMLLQ